MFSCDELQCKIPATFNGKEEEWYEDGFVDCDFFLISEHYITLSHPQKILSNFCQLPALVLVEQTHQSYDLLSLSDRKTCKTTTPATFMKRPHTASKQLSCSSMYCLKSGS